MYNYEINPSLRDILNKLSKKDNPVYERVLKKIDEITKSFDVEHYKNLKYDLKEFKRVQVGEKVLVFKFDKKINLIKFIDFDHHDNIYKKKF